jgi:DNA-binding IclR family transcriptional regulator
MIMLKREREFPEPDKAANLDNDNSPDSFIARITNILRCLSEGINTVNDIARNCNLSSSTTHRLLNMLREPLFVVYDASRRRYYLGPQVIELTAKPAATHQYLLMNALDELNRLSSVTGETIRLNLALGIQLIFLYEIPGKQDLTVIQKRSEIRPVMPRGAANKVLLSQMNDKNLELALKAAENWKPALVHSPFDETRDMLRKIRQQGYAVTRGEAILDCIGISAPIKNYFCPVAVSIIGPDHRLDGKIDELTKEVLASADKISQNLLDFVAVQNKLDHI